MTKAGPTLNAARYGAMGLGASSGGFRSRGRCTTCCAAPPSSSAPAKPGGRWRWSRCGKAPHGVVVRCRCWMPRH